MENLTYEEAMKRLEKIVELLEEGSKPLEETLKMFEEGTKLVNFCNKSLNEAEQKIIQLSSLETEGSKDETVSS
ncbi:MAG: exodeoxyribonuclease VII small subunit [Clostridiales bacterium]|nr:exodeoxyribonuclease VII small subunit [Clostridiales bacterium]